MAFKTSVNLKLDAGKDEFVNRYIPSKSHTTALKSILKSTSEEDNSSHIIVGPYGTGKSLLATVVNNLVSNNSSEESLRKLGNKFEYFDDEISSLITVVRRSDRKFLTILLSGYEGRFREVVVSKMTELLRQEGIEVLLPGVSEKIIGVVNDWEENYKKTYKQFVEILKNDNKKISSWLESVKRQEQNEILYFERIYPELTSGATLNLDYGDDFLTKIEYLSNLAENHGLGLYIIFDEFGRFLQSLDSSLIHETMEDIQDLAEIVNRRKSLQLILITHKSLRQYFSKQNLSIAEEFQKIEKRFLQYFISNDQDTFFKIAEIIIRENINNKPKISPKKLDKVTDELKEFTLFPTLNPHEREKKIVKTLYPVHPATLYLLPYLSELLGQNDRTLFTFLESEETGGLKNHIDKTNTYYYPYQLFDYFFQETDEDIKNDINNQLLKFRKARSRLHPDMEDQNQALNILKTISLWEMCGLQTRQGITTDFLQFALQINVNKLETLLNELTYSKVLRFNQITKAWELHTGSSINLEENIEQAKEHLINDKDQIKNILYNNLGTKYFFPNEYNDNKFMTRFASVKVVTSSELDNIDINLMRKADLYILYVLKDDNQTTKDITKRLKSYNRSDVIIYLHPRHFSEVKDQVQKYFIIEEMSKDNELLKEDNAIKEELNFFLNESIHLIKEYMNDIDDFSSNGSWFIDGKKVNIYNKTELSSKLTELCDEIFKETPKIVNDSFNRMNITSAQKKAAINVVDQIIKNYDEPQFGISGNGPDYAIFAGIFRVNNSFDLNINNLEYDSIEDSGLYKLREEIIDHLENNPKGNFESLVSIFLNKPFGIRTPVIPILFVALLRDRWDDFILTRNEMFISNLDGEALYEILYEEGSWNYEYIYENFDDKYIKLFNYVEKYFSEYNEEALFGRSRLIKTCSYLLKWLRSLPRITQLSEQTTKEFKWFRDVIRQSEVKPQASVEKLFYKFEKNNNFFEKMVYYGENYLERFTEKLQEDFLENLGLTSLSDVKNWLNNKHDYLKKNNNLVNIITKVDSDKFFNDFIELYIGVPVRNWADSTSELFFRQLEIDLKEIDKFEHSEFEAEIEEEVLNITINGKSKYITNSDLSVKSNTIYKNINRMLNNAGKNIPQNEIEYMIYKLANEYIE